MNIKDYIIQTYSIVLNSDDYKTLENYLLSNINEISSEDDLKGQIRNYIFKNYKPKLKFGIDNSDLKQALLLLKTKTKNTK
ncbi:MAG: hypothetical protein P4L59_08065 [Desulfosporosinus sp.]|nr:hypothetical protein [Desulfosporosinus sp.]